MKKNLKNLHSLNHNVEGGVLIMVGVFILIIFAIAGAGIDFGRAQLLKMKEQQASDAAALAAANILDKDTIEANEKAIREDAALRYYNLNFPTSYMGVTREEPDFKFNKGQGDITITNSQTIKTNYITTVGRSDLKVNAATKVNIPSKNFPDFDVSVILDNSGSTAELMPSGKTRLETEKDAVLTMIESLFPDNQPKNPDLRLGLIVHAGAITSAHGLTADKEQLKSFVPTIGYTEWTYSHYGLEAAYNMINGIWTGYVPPQKCTTSKTYTYNICVPEKNTGMPEALTDRSDGKQLSKVRNVVFMTDGMIMIQAAPCKVDAPIDVFRVQYPIIMKDDVAEAGDTCRNFRKFHEQCDKIKASGATLYTINFADEDPDSATNMKKCASSPDKYYFAPDEVTLKNILSGIATQAKRIRITE